MNAKLKRGPSFPPPPAPPRDDLPLAVGDLVVYASHGIGRVESRKADGDDGEVLALVFENGLKVTLPLDRARSTLRALAGEAELADVERTLRTDSPPSSGHWSRRHRDSQAKLAGGSVGDLAEIVRDGAQRERDRPKGGTAPMTNQLYRTALQLLIAEVAVARGIEPDAAIAWIDHQINADRAEPDQPRP